MNRYSYNQSELILKLTSSLFPRRISNHGQIINHDVLKSTQFAWSTMLLRSHGRPYDAAVQDPIIAASMRTELVDLLILQDDNLLISLSFGRQRELISLPTLGPPRKSIIPTGTLNEPNPAFALMVSDKFLMLDFDPDATEAPTLAIEHTSTSSNP